MTKQEVAKCAQLDMLIELDRICEKYKIPYFLVGGSLIGAIRHNGFIPWDDDIDVGMFREDYERFKKNCSNNLHESYALYDWCSDDKSPLPFLKMKIKGTHYVEELSKNTQMNNEIFIDIFPFDNAPNSRLLQCIHAVKNIVLKKVILLKCGFLIKEGSILRIFLYTLLQGFFYFNSVENLKKSFFDNATKYRRKKTDYVVNLCGAYSYQKELKQRFLLDKIMKHDFENISVNIPVEYDLYLKGVYGNYMELPPEEKRESRHRVSLIDLGCYRVKSKLKN